MDDDNTYMNAAEILNELDGLIHAENEDPHAEDLDHPGRLVGDALWRATQKRDWENRGF